MEGLCAVKCGTLMSGDGDGLVGLCIWSGILLLLLWLIWFLVCAAGGVSGGGWWGALLGGRITPEPPPPPPPLLELIPADTIVDPVCAPLALLLLMALLRFTPFSCDEATTVVGWDLRERLVACVCGGGRITRDMIGVGATIPAGSGLVRPWKQTKTGENSYNEQSFRKTFLQNIFRCKLFKQ